MGKNTISASAKTLSTVLYSFQVVLFLTSGVSSHVCTDQFFAEYLSGRLLSAFSSPLFCPTNSTCLDLPRLTQFKETTVPSGWTPPPCSTAGKLSRQQTRAVTELTSFVSHLSGIIFFAVQCPKSRKPLFCIFRLPFKLFQAGG